MKPKPVTLEYVRTPRIWNAEIPPLGISAQLWRESVLRDEMEQDRRYRERMKIPYPSDTDAQ